MRTVDDRKEVLRVFKEVFEVTPFINPYPRIQLNSHHLIVGNVTIKRNHVQLTTSSSKQLLMLPEIRQSLESAARCVEQRDAEAGEQRDGGGFLFFLFTW